MLEISGMMWRVVGMSMGAAGRTGNSLTCQEECNSQAAENSLQGYPGDFNSIAGSGTKGTNRPHTVPSTQETSTLGFCGATQVAPWQQQLCLSMCISLVNTLPRWKIYTGKKYLLMPLTVRKPKQSRVNS